MFSSKLFHVKQFMDLAINTERSESRRTEGFFGSEWKGNIFTTQNVSRETFWIVDFPVDKR